MTDPAPASPYTLRQATPADRPFLDALNERSYRDVVERQFGAWDGAQQREKFEGKWRRGCYEIVLMDGNAVGAFLLEQHDDHFFLADVQIDSPYRGQGLGTRILDIAWSRAAARRLPLRLRVLHLNRARRLYERLGFRQYGATETHYLMEKSSVTSA